MLFLNQSNNVTFAVNVQGSSAAPVVRCMLGEDPSSVFNANKLKDGLYEVLITPPSSMTAGLQPFKIEVILNGRLFTPIKRLIEVMDSDTQTIQKEPAVESHEPKKFTVRRLEQIDNIATPKELDKVIKEKMKISIIDIANETTADVKTHNNIIESPQTLRIIVPISFTKGKILYR